MKSIGHARYAHIVVASRCCIGATKNNKPAVILRKFSAANWSQDTVIDVIAKVSNRDLQLMFAALPSNSIENPLL